MAGDVKVAVVSGPISSSGTGTADFTKSGFGTPKACIVLLSFDAADNVSPAAEGKASIGFSDFTNHRCITHQDEDGSAKVDSDARKSPTKAYVLLTIAAAVDIDGTASAITDGVRLTNTTNGSASAVFATVIMFGGADLAITVASTSINSSQDGTATSTHSGFTDGNDKLIFFVGTDISGEDSSSSGINNSFGVCHVTGSDAGGYTFTQRCLGWASDHNNVVGSPSAIISTDRVLDIITEVGGQDWGLEVTAFSSSSNNFTVTTRDNGAGAGMEVYSLALDLDDRKSKVGSVGAPSSGTSWTPSVALGFTPQYVGLGLTRVTTENVIASTGGQVGSSGISSNTGSGEETCHSFYNDLGAATTNTNNLFRSRVIDLRTDTGVPIAQDHSHSSFNSGGWTYTINTENEADAKKWFYWTIEEATIVTTIQQAIDASVTGTPVLSIAITFVKTIAASVTGTAVLTLVKTFARTIAATATGTVGLTKLVRKTIAASVVGSAVVSAGKLFSRAIAASVTGTATLITALFFTKSIPSSVTGTAVLSTETTFVKTIAAVVTGTVTLVKLVKKSITAAATGTAAVVKGFGKTIAASVVGTAGISSALLFARTVAATATGTAVFSTTLTFVETITASVTGTAIIVTNFIAGAGAQTGAFVVNICRRRGRR